MNFPQMQETNAPIKRQVIEFKGYDVQSYIDDGSMRDMLNLSSDRYPALSQRKKRGIYAETYTNPSSIYARNEKLVVIDGSRFYYDGVYKFDLNPTYTSSSIQRQIQAINDYIVVFPDKMFYKISDGTYGALNASVSFSQPTIRHNSNTGWEELVFDSSIDLSAFKIGDAVNLSGFVLCNGINNQNPLENNNQTGAIIKNIGQDSGTNAKYMAFGEGVLFYVASQSKTTYQDTGTVTIERAVPDMSYIMEYNNRLYGAKDNTIYASKLGDPSNWYYYENGLADCSYTVAVGSDGDFTGIAPFSNHIVFFKENCIHKLYGNKPSNYQIITSKCLGLESGSHRSISSIDDVIYYKSREGIMAYTGDLPSLISYNFGDIKYQNAIAGTDGLKYYISMQNKNDSKYYMFCYDIARGIWLIEDNTHALDFAFLGSRLLYSDADSKKILSTSPMTNTITSDNRMHWYAVFGDYDEIVEEKKVYSRVNIRLNMEADSEILVSYAVDGGDWKVCKHFYTMQKRAVEIPVIPTWCDKFRIKIEGKGFTEIESITRIVREGTMR